MTPSSRHAELLRYLEGDLTVARARELEAELAGSEPLRAELAAVERLTGDLAATDPELEKADLLPSLHAALDREQSASPRGRVRRLFAMAGGAAALAAAAMVALVVWPTGNDGFRAKGSAASGPVDSRWAGIEGYRVGQGRVLGRVDKWVKRGEALAFAYRNGGESPFGYLMIFAVTPDGRVFWFDPAWEDAAKDPESISIGSAPNAVELREAVNHELPPGPITIHGLFTRQPLRVSEVERKIARQVDSLGGPGAVDHTLILSVEP